MERYYYIGNEKLSDLKDIYMSQLSKYDNSYYKKLLAIKECGGSDYSGNTRTKANYKYFRDNYSEIDGVFFMHGGYDSYGILIDPALIDSSSDIFNSEINDLIINLENYPVISDDSLSALESELEQEAWESYGRYDFRKGLQLAYKKDDECCETELIIDNEWRMLAGEDIILSWEEFISDLDDNTLDKLWYHATEKSNTYVSFETGCICYFNTDRVVKWCYESQLLDYLVIEASNA